jgi:hypothetical protein
MDQNMTNEVRAEGLREDFYQAITDGDWPVAREILSLMEDMSVDTRAMRFDMNNAMYETDDITYEPYEAVIPVMTEEETYAWMEPRFGTFHITSEGETQGRLSAEFGPNNA